mmetsp:Transcript_102876/g.330068  ORF Transcript_102876/g.330068 Transcript_102876/m.330068 type:complete len:204 (-) Transcript_102876:73-684(-)
MRSRGGELHAKLEHRTSPSAFVLVDDGRLEARRSGHRGPNSALLLRPLRRELIGGRADSSPGFGQLGRRRRRRRRAVERQRVRGVVGRSQRPGAFGRLQRRGRHSLGGELLVPARRQQQGPRGGGLCGHADALWLLASHAYILLHGVRGAFVEAVRARAAPALVAAAAGAAVRGRRAGQGRRRPEDGVLMFGNLRGAQRQSSC